MPFGWGQGLQAWTFRVSKQAYLLLGIAIFQINQKLDKLIKMWEHCKGKPRKVPEIVFASVNLFLRTMASRNTFEVAKKTFTLKLLKGLN